MFFFVWNLSQPTFGEQHGQLTGALRQNLWGTGNTGNTSPQSQGLS